MSRDPKRTVWTERPLPRFKTSAWVRTKVQSLVLALLALTACGTGTATPTRLPLPATSTSLPLPTPFSPVSPPTATLIPTVTPRPTPSPTPTSIPGSATCTTYHPSGLEGPIWDIDVAPYGKVWIAAYRGVARLDLSTAAWKTYTREDGLASDQAWSITGGPGLAAWLPLRDSAGIAYFDGTSWTHYTSEDGLPSDDVRTISVARDGSVWFATTEGAFRWDREAASGELQAVGTWTYYTSAAGLYSDQVEKVLFTPDGRIWFAHLGALTYLLPASSEGEHDTWGTYGQSRFLATRKAMVSRDGRLWVGQALFDPASQKWIDTTYRDLHLQGLTVDRRGGLWIARQDGALYLPDPVSGSRDTWLYYGQAQGLASDDVFVIALESDGVVWFGTLNGASRCVLE